MKINKNPQVDAFINEIENPERKEAFTQLRNELLQNLPEGFEEVIAYKMPSYVVPLKKYPDGYHYTPNTPLMLISISNGKNYISLHHLGLYANKPLLSWFETEFAKNIDTKLDMGKGCVRFKKMNQIPFGLIGQLASKLSPDQWIEMYENAFPKKK